MSDIFDEIDKDINLTKNKNKKDEDEKNRIEKEIDKFKEKIFKLNCSADFDKLHTLLKKHTKDDNKIKINQITEPYDCRLELSQKLYGPDGNYTNYIDIEWIDFKQPPILPELEDLKNYKFDENNFGFKVSRSTSDGIHDEKFSMEEKKFKINQKDNAIKFFVEIFKKNFIR